MRQGLLYEAGFVGVYVTLLYYVFRIIIGDISRPLFYFFLGFMKHMIGYIIGMHSYFCGNRGIIRDISRVFAESILEGIVFVVISRWINNEPSRLFIASIGLHIGAELTGIHGLFIKYRCNDKIYQNRGI